MPIADYVIPTKAVPLPGNKSFEVRGLALADITYLVQNHLGDLIRAVDLYSRQKRNELTRASLADFAMLVARDIPTLASEIISTCADEPDAKDKVAKLPVLVQINALLAAVELTMQEAGGLKNLFAFVAPMLGDVVNSAGAEPGTLKRQLLDSIMDSGKTPASADTQGIAV